MLKLATLCYLRAGGKTLMMHRIKRANDMHAGKWNGLGGKLLPGETPEACAIREVQEESGLTIHAPVLRGILTFPGFPTGNQSQFHDPNSDDWYTFVFVADSFTGTLTEGEEGVLAWIDDEQLLALNLWPGDRIFLKWLDHDAFFSGRFVYINEALVEHDVVFYRGAQRLPESNLPAVDNQAADSPIAEKQTDPPGHQPVYQPKDDTYCWLCHGPVIKRHCKIVCQTCGFTRDCSDP
ncbi:MAG: 8-oxo-dGTP diphosphatase [Caldilineaceae bacterium]|nr:8-oxo-dGTP diphosphatase [Caldilineaceae bacterium]